MPAHRKWKPCIKTCEICLKKFKAVTGAAIRKQRFCSPKCRSKSHRRPLTWTCEQCGKKRTTSPSKKKRFCSHACKGAWNAEHGITAGEKNSMWSGGGLEYWKRKARERDDFTCQIAGCGVRDEGAGTQAHHKLPQSLDGDHSLDNLITLCSAHHVECEQLLYKELARRHPKLLRRLVAELYAPQVVDQNPFVQQ